MLTKLGDHAPGEAAVADATALLAAWSANRTPSAPGTSALALVQLAGIHGVAWPVTEALETALPAAAMFCRPIRAEAQAQAEAAFDAMIQAAGTLNAIGVEPVALKGGAFYAAAGKAVAWRSMVDADLLVPRARMAECLDALAEAGWTGRDDGRVYRWTWDCYAHPPLVPPGGGFSLELHSRCSYERRGVLDGLLERAVPGGREGLRAPSPEDRISHLVHQALLMDRGLPRRVVRLRDLLDWRMIRRDLSPDLGEVEQRFRRHGQREAFEAFRALAGEVWQEADAPEPSPSARVWAMGALAGMADPGRLERRVMSDKRRAAIDMFTKPGMLREYVSRLFLGPLRQSVRARTGKMLHRWMGRQV